MYLVWSVANADVEIREVCLDHVSKYNVEAFLGGGALNTFSDLGRHSRIELHGDDLFRFLEDFHGKVTGTGTNF